MGIGNMNNITTKTKDSSLQSFADSISTNRDIIKNTAQALKEKIESGELIEQDCPVVHRFSPGLYLREILMPKGTRIIGKIHATEHFNVVLTGRCTVITVEGIMEIEAPYTFISKAGIQKVVIVHDDCQWQTLHVTNKTEIDEIEKEVIAEDYDQLQVDGIMGTVKGLLS
tara:strand:- start:96 stop:605 length:510 start_codon:yes stop_codon:yes gene_type:complete